jgi:hypothetical protein
MEAMRDAWTDERLDDLNRRVDGGFREMREEFRAIRLESKAEFAAMRSEIAAMNRTMLQIVVGGFGVMLVGFAGTIATIVSQA